MSLRPVYPGFDEMRGRVGVVVPAWFSDDTPVTAAAELLLTTLIDSPCCLRPGDVCVVVDGSETARAAVAAIREEVASAWGFRLIDLPENRGKGGAVVAGVRALLEASPELCWIATRDADADHAIEDLPHLFRVGEQLAEECPGQAVCVIGRRADLHAPLGWVRGEYELLLNEVLVEAVAFALAREGRAWDTRYLAERAPDLQSGYKLYSREAAASAVAALQKAGAADAHLLRAGMEVVPFVTLALSGAVFAEVERKTFHDQPVTSYGSVDFTRFYGSKLAWALRTCRVPLAAAALLFDGAAGRRPLYTDPDGRAGILALRRFVLEHLAGGPLPAGIPPEPRTRRFL